MSRQPVEAHRGTYRLRAARATREFVTGGLAGLFGLVVIWYVVSSAGLVSHRVLPPPQTVFVRFLEDLSAGALTGHAWRTTRAWVLGLANGVLAGAIIGALLGRIDWLWRAARPYLAFFNATPRVILAPVFILLLGIGLRSQVALAISLVLFVMIFGMQSGIRSVPDDLKNAVLMMGGREGALWRFVLIPGALPQVLTALRVSVALALIGAVVAEMLGSGAGIGWLLVVRGQVFDVAGVFSVIVTLGILAAIGNKLVEFISTRLLRSR